jgi:hypothetical protein
VIHAEQIKIILSYRVYHMADFAFSHLALDFRPLRTVLEQLTKAILPIVWVGSSHFGSDVGYD